MIVIARSAAYKPRGPLTGTRPLLYAVALFTDPDGALRALAPDLQNCDLTGSAQQELLPRLRLAMESELTRLILAGTALPDARDGRPLPGFVGISAGSSAVRWLTIHINLAHLQALARHQAQRPAEH
jgi:hypothetical protein